MHSLRSLFRVLDQAVDTRTLVEVSFVEVLRTSTAFISHVLYQQVFNEEVRDLLSDNLSGVFIDYDQEGNPRLAGLNQVRGRHMAGF
jgi:hypothetical protein